MRLRPFVTVRVVSPFVSRPEVQQPVAEPKRGSRIPTCSSKFRFYGQNHSYHLWNLLRPPGSETKLYPPPKLANFSYTRQSKPGVFYLLLFLYTLLFIFLIVCTCDLHMSIHLIMHVTRHLMHCSTPAVFLSSSAPTLDYKNSPLSHYSTDHSIVLSSQNYSFTLTTLLSAITNFITLKLSVIFLFEAFAPTSHPHSILITQHSYLPVKSPSSLSLSTTLSTTHIINKTQLHHTSPSNNIFLIHISAIEPLVTLTTEIKLFIKSKPLYQVTLPYLHNFLFKILLHYIIMKSPHIPCLLSPCNYGCLAHGCICGKFARLSKKKDFQKQTTEKSQPLGRKNCHLRYHPQVLGYHP
ncbi:hypothetical protein VP01_619g1 [Puccinia sorghi]|uniref:Uncharacterized protein n=1 Tax=Puccinia sorghi TaxID=27349 RepID=A0A0L6UGN6_9BASI|nr:hypothetical protein VP01_619g1 [Puccinia sorghi]